MVCMFFIAFLHNSCNFQYLILGWSTLVLSPSIIVCEPSQAVVSNTHLAFLNTEVMSDLCKVSLFDFSGLIYIYVAYFNQLLHCMETVGCCKTRFDSEKIYFTETTLYLRLNVLFWYYSGKFEFSFVTVSSRIVYQLYAL